MPLPDTVLRSALQKTLDSTDLDALGQKYEGKVRDNYSTTDGRRIIVVTDRISAFDRVLGTLPLQRAGPEPARRVVVREDRDRSRRTTCSRCPIRTCSRPSSATPLPVEMVVRAYVTGVTSTSIWTHYAAGEREFCGHKLPDGLRKHQRLPAPILTPSTKAPKGDHDVSASRAEILAMGGMSAEDFDLAAELAMGLFDFGARCAERGLILVDTKYEFGKTPDGRIVVIDEIHTPDSSRFWFTRIVRGAFRQGARSPSRSTRSTCVAGSRVRASKATVPSRRSPTTCAWRRRDGTSRLTRPSRASRSSPNLEEPQARLAQEPGALMKATVYVRLKGEVLDPQGDAVRSARSLRSASRACAACASASSSRSSSTKGAEPGPELAKKLTKMADEMLANPVIEDYEVKVG